MSARKDYYLNMKFCGRLVVLLFFCCCFLCGSAQFRVYSNEFLNIGAGARGLAMGGAQVASAEDGNAGYWNPAGLVNVIDHPNISLMHADYFAANSAAGGSCRLQFWAEARLGWSLLLRNGFHNRVLADFIAPKFSHFFAIAQHNHTVAVINHFGKLRRNDQ